MHPCQFSPEVIETLRNHIQKNERIHDPFAGTGLRLALLCDDIKATYSGTDIEEWPEMDHRVMIGDSTMAYTYPNESFTIVTSPVYLNKRLADYANGPLPTTKTKGRRDYGISLGRALHPNNLARHTGRPSRARMYWHFHALAISHWKSRVLLNVDSPIETGWIDLLTNFHYKIEATISIKTQRYGGLDNADNRAAFEVLIIANKDRTFA